MSHGAAAVKVGNSTLVKDSDKPERYRAELDQKPESWRPLLAAAREGDITLVYGARNTQYNNAVVLKAYLEDRLVS